MSGDEKAPEGVALLEWANKHLQAQVVSVARGSEDGATVLVVPSGFEVRDIKPVLDKYRTAPERITGKATLLTVQSFCAHVERFKSEATAIFAGESGLTAVYNYHRRGAPAFADHRAVFAYPRSAAWRAWKAIDGKSLDQRAFAEWLEAHAEDVLGAGSTSAHERLDQLGLKIGPQSEIVGLAKGLNIRIESDVSDSETLATGAVKIAYSSEIKGEKGAALTVPSGFVVAIPVLDEDAAYPLPVRLRFRVESQRVKWSMHLLGADDVERDAIRLALDQVAKATGVPIYHGTPE